MREEIDIINSVLIGNKESEKVLYEKYKVVVKDYLIGKYSEYSDIDDDISDIMIKIFLKLKKFDINKSAFKSWVITLTKNHMIDKWRSSGISTSTGNSNGTYYVDISSVTNTMNVDDYASNDIDYTNTGITYTCSSNLDVSFENNFENANTLNYISGIIDSCDYTMLDMKYVQGYNYTEIGDVFNISSSTVSNRVNYIKAKLKNEYGNDI